MSILPVPTNKSAGDNAALEEEITEALLLMEAGLANPKQVNPTLVRLWVMVLTAAGIQAHEIAPVTAQMLIREKFFPTPSDFVNYAQDLAFAPVEFKEPTEEELLARYEESRRRMAADRAHFDAIRAAKQERVGATIQ